MKKRKYKKNNWFKKHWDEVLLILGILLTIYFILKGAGYFQLKMRKKIVYIISILALGAVIFNNSIQLAESIKLNTNYMIALLISMSVSITYGIVNLK